MPSENEFEKANQEKPAGIVREFLQFLPENKKWWLLPIVVVLVLCSLLVFVAGALHPISTPCYNSLVCLIVTTGSLQAENLAQGE